MGNSVGSGAWQPGQETYADPNCYTEQGYYEQSSFDVSYSDARAALGMMRPEQSQDAAQSYGGGAAQWQEWNQQQTADAIWQTQYTGHTSGMGAEWGACGAEWSTSGCGW